MLPCCFALLLGWGGDPVPTTPWAFDEVILKNGARFRGMIVNETAAGIDFQVVHQKRGRPTLTSTTSFTPREVFQVNRLSDAERAALRQKIAELDPHGVGEKQRMESLELAAADWRGKPGAAKRYDSDHFSLTASTSDEITRRAAVRLEQIYAAFERVLPPRHRAARPTTVILAGQMDDYTALVGPVKNPSIYDPATNRIVCGSNLRQLGEDLTVARAHHTRELARLDQYESDIRQLYKGQQQELERFLGLAKSERNKLAEARRVNGKRFDEATRRLFAVLYHEAFHSYTATFVYPPRTAEEVRAGKGTGELPRWLNEGLGQVFEAAIVEAGELRVEAPDAERLAKVQELLRPKAGRPPGLVPLADLLRARKETFLAEHASQLAVADRAYLTAWGVAYYLTFEKRIVGSKELDKYLVALNTGDDPVAAFEAWIDQPIAAFEKDLTAYLLRLESGGTLLPPKGAGK
jgi:hypothetical protein